MRIFLIVLGFVLGCKTSSFGQSLMFKLCQTETDKEICQQKQLILFQSKVKADIFSSLGYSLTDSLFLEFVVNEQGEVSFGKTFALVSDEALSMARPAIRRMARQLKANENYAFFLNLSIDERFEKFTSIYKLKNAPVVRGAENFNSKAQLACFNYVLRGDEKWRSQVDDDFNVRCYLEKGKVVAVECEQISLNKSLVEKVSRSVNNGMAAEVSSEAWANLAPFYLEFKSSIKGDSTKRWEGSMRRLAHFKTLSQKKFYLEELYDFKDKFSRADPNKWNNFFLKHLNEAGYGEAREVSIWGKVYPMDSIRAYSYTEVEKEETDDVLNFSMVERVPVFAGCDSTLKNEELRACFQRGLLVYVSKSFVFPEQERMTGTGGKMYIGFVIGVKGEVENIEIVKGVNRSLDFESIRVVSELTRCSPALQRAKPCRMSFILPINAKIQGSAPKKKKKRRR
mgnify:CR=1 FL=1